MKFRSSIAAAALVVVSLAGGIAATAASDTGAARKAASAAKDAGKALAKHKADKAVKAAESAVAYAPDAAAYRVLLGQAYLAAGRFTSASQALGDALALEPGNATAALHLALAQIATGEWSAARGTLAANPGIGAADRGLATALAGDPAGAVEILMPAARAPGADAKTRQNLALSLALAGRWPEAKSIAALDVSPGEIDARIMQWAAFAQPKSASDQVAALLSVRPVEDGGQPERLALRDAAPTLAAVTQPVDPVDAYMPRTAEIAVETAPVVEVAVTPEPAPVLVAPRREIVQPVRTPAVRPPAVKVAAKPAAAKPVAARALTKGGFYVQLGAFENPAVAKVAWGRMARGPLAGLTPAGMPIRGFYRLSVGGFARPDANALCARVRGQGGRCFVRAGAGDQVASWIKGGGVQVAAR